MHARTKYMSTLKYPESLERERGKSTEAGSPSGRFWVPATPIRGYGLPARHATPPRGDGHHPDHGGHVGRCEFAARWRRQKGRLWREGVLEGIRSLHIKAESQALSALTLKYNCSKEAKSLVAQLDAVVTSNYAAEKKLNWSCAAAQSSYKRELAGKIAAATALASTANQKGADIYASGYAAANKTFLEIQSHYDTVMESANARLRESQMKAAEARQSTTKKSQLRMAAQALFEQKCSLIDDAAATEITVLGGNRTLQSEIQNLHLKKQ